MTHHLYPLNVEVHHIVQRPSVAVVQRTVETNQISVLQPLQDLSVVKDRLAVQGQQDVWLAVLPDARLHLHEETQCVLVVLS